MECSLHGGGPWPGGRMVSFPTKKGGARSWAGSVQALLARLREADERSCLQVFKGILNGSLPVAIKSIKDDSSAAKVGFIEEIVCLMNLRHTNVRRPHPHPHPALLHTTAALLQTVSTRQDGRLLLLGSDDVCGNIAIQTKANAACCSSPGVIIGKTGGGCCVLQPRYTHMFSIYLQQDPLERYMQAPAAAGAEMAVDKQDWLQGSVYSHNPGYCRACFANAWFHAGACGLALYGITMSPQKESSWDKGLRCTNCCASACHSSMIHALPDPDVASPERWTPPLPPRARGGGGGGRNTPMPPAAKPWESSSKGTITPWDCIHHIKLEDSPL